MRLIIALLLMAGSVWAAPPRVAARLTAFAHAHVSPALPTTPGGRVAVSVRVAGGAATLKQAGYAIDAAAGEIVYLKVNPAELQRLIRLSGVKAIEPARRLHPSLDISVPLTGATTLREQQNLTGRGVVVGIVDTGIDFRQQDFRDPTSGATRIAALLDVSLPEDNRHPAWSSYGGAMWDAAEIDAQLAADAAGAIPAVSVAEVDSYGHGTHVAGIAAGNGQATGRDFPAYRYIGMAPQATLIVVKAARNGPWFGEADILAGTRFVLDRARELGLPAVVNLSLSGEGGPHDGTTNLELTLAELFPPDTPGRALVVAAGNDAARQWHAGNWSLDGNLEVNFALPQATSADTVFSIDLWTSDDPALPTVTIVSPNGHTFGPVAANMDLDSQQTCSEGRVVIHGLDATDPINSRHEASIDISGSGNQPVSSGTWQLLLSGQVTRWDAWISPSDSSAPRFLDSLDSTINANYPAFCTSAIAVGSTVSRSSWINIDGDTITRSITPGDPSAFSGTGPSSDGRFVPDVVAPGEFIISSLSSNATPDQPDSVFAVPGSLNYLWADDGVHGVLRGTSQATPHVSGAVALLLQLSPLLFTQQIKELIRTSARDDISDAGFSPKTGFGELDVAAAARLLKHTPAQTVNPLLSSVTISRDLLPPGAGSVLISVIPRDFQGIPLGPGHRLLIATTAGRFSDAVTDLGVGRYERTLTAEASSGSLGRITVYVDGVELASHPSVLFASSFAPAAPAGNSGCHLASPPTRNRDFLLAAAIALACLLGRRRVVQLARGLTGR